MTHSINAVANPVVKADNKILSQVKKNKVTENKKKKDPYIMALVMIYYNVMKGNQEISGAATTKMTADEKVLANVTKKLDALYKTDPNSQQGLIKMQNQTTFYDNIATMTGEDLSMVTELQVVNPSEQNRILAKEGTTLVQFYDQFAKIRA